MCVCVCVSSQNLELDSDPSLLHSVFPCAHHYHIEQCPLPTHARPLSHATSLSHLTLRPPAHRSPAEWRAQLQALESLPGLCSVDLSADMFTEGVTPRLAQQLTSMTLLAFNGDSLVSMSCAFIYAMSCHVSFMPCHAIYAMCTCVLWTTVADSLVTV